MSIISHLIFMKNTITFEGMSNLW